MNSLHILYPDLDNSNLSTEQTDLLPRHKGDFERANKLKDLPAEQLQPLMPHLIYWLQDINWPIADAIASLFVKSGITSLDLIKKVLDTNDIMWKYWVLKEVVYPASEEVAIALKDILSEIEESSDKDLREIARLILKKIDNR